MSFALTNAISRTESGNVIGVIPGADAKRASQAVIYTAHHDHLGVKAGVKPGDDAIYNGAIDNASGVASILSVARAFTRVKVPARSVYFAFVAGEEQGLLGSEYLVKHPPVLSGRIAANINIDGVGWFGRTRDVAMIGLGKSSLDSDVAALAAAQGRRVEPDQFPDRGSFYRSDQFSFARAGVPAAYLKTGTDVIGKPAGYGREQIESWVKAHYHQPSDELQETWDLEGAAENAQLVFYLGKRVADAKGMPTWKPRDEFEDARKKALDEVASRSEQ
jgi:Zn-dependent M28 family amino/carboxypeptidase